MWFPGDKVYELEADLEKDVVKLAKARGWWTRKYKHAGRRAAPDREFVKAGVRFLAELKRQGKTPTEQQYLEITEMRAVGLDVVWLDSIEDFRACLVVREAC